MSNRRNSTFKKSLLFAAVCSVLTLPAIAEEDATEEEESEKMIITGSHIKRSGFDNKSPVQIIDAKAIQDSGASTVIDLVLDLPVNMGSELVNDSGSLTGTNQFNLRGLGLSSTLTLVNGRRAGTSTVADGSGYSFFDVNSIPLNAIGRIDVLTDGASATYGSEAVAGVVNIVTRKGFEGFELTAERNSSVNDITTVGFALGLTGDKGSFGLYGTRYKQTGAQRTDFDFIVDRLNTNDPQLNAFTSGRGSPGSYFIADVDNSAGFTTVTQRPGAQRSPDADCALVGILRGSTCRLDFSEQRGELPVEDRFQLFAEADYDINDSTIFFAEASFSRNLISRFQEGSKNHARGTVNGRKYIPSDHPFNFWVEDPNDPTALVYRGPTISAIGATPVWNSTDEADWANGTLVAADLSATIRPLGHFDGFPGELNPVEIEHIFMRSVVGLDVDLVDDWKMNVSYMHSINTRTRNEPYNFIAEKFDGVNPLNPSAIGSGAWNPFGTRVTAPGLVSPKDGESTAGNTLQDLDLFRVSETRTARTEQKVFDLIVTGDAFDLPNGEVLSVAIGGQYRTDSLEQHEDDFRTFGLDGNLSPIPNINDSFETASIFAEALVPLAENLELQLALRHENFRQSGNTTDPKIAMRWQPLEFLSFRTSWGTSFQEPTVRQKGESIGTNTVDDLCNNGGTFQTSHITTGDDSLKPQSSKNFNFGILYEAGNDFSASVDFWRFDYADLIIGGQSAQSIIDADFAAGCVGNANIIRDSSGQLQITRTSSSNAGKVVTQGADMILRYGFDLSNLGRIDFSSNISYVDTFEVQQANGTTIEAVGNRNSKVTSFRPIPVFRGNFSTTWNLNDHTAIATVRYIDSYTNDAFNGRSVLVKTISSHVTLDLQYNLSLDNIFGENHVNLSFGAINVLDEAPPSIGGRPGYDRFTHDPRGRRIYGKLSVEF